MAAEKTFCCFLVVVTLMVPMVASMELECDIQINPQQVITRCAQFSAPYLTDQDQNKLIELFFEFIEVFVGNSTEVPKANDTEKVRVVLMSLCYRYQLLTDNPKLIAFVFDCMMENPLSAGSSIEEATKCQVTEKTTECVMEKYEKLCPSESGNRARRAAAILAGSHQLLAHM